MELGVYQSALPGMGVYWDPVKNLGLNILNGTITADNAKENLDKTMELLNSTGL